MVLPAESETIIELDYTDEDENSSMLPGDVIEP
jgi:hypothetical protein